MADFSVNATQMAGPQEAGSAPVQAVQERAANPLGGVIGVLDSAVDLFAFNSKKNQKLDEEARKQQALSRYASEQATINSAVMTGAMTPAESRVRSQTLLDQHLATGMYTSEISQLHSTFVKGTALGDVEQVAQTEKDRLKAGVQAAQSDGIEFPPNASVPTQNAIVAAWQAQKRAKQDSDEEMKNIRFQRESKDWNDKQADAVAKQQGIQTINKIAASQIDLSGAFITGLVDSVKASPGSYDTALASFTSHFAKIESTLQAAAGNHPELAGSYRSLFADLKRVGEKMLDPKNQTEALDNEYKMLVNKMKLTAVQTDPKILGYAALSQILGANSDLALSAAKAGSSINNLLENMNTPAGGYLQPPNLINDPKTLSSSMDILDKTLKSTGFDMMKDPAKARTEVRNAFDNILEQTSVALDKGMPAKDIERVMKTLASPEFGAYVKKEGYSPQGIEAVRKAIQINYNKTITQAVGQKLEEYVYGGAVFSRGGSEAPVTALKDTVDVKFNGSGISFMAKQGAGNDPVAKGDVKDKVKALNDASAGVNRMIQVAAHLEGTTDYAAIWDKYKHTFVPQLYPNKKGDIVEYNGVKYSYKDLPNVSYTDRSNWQPVK